MCKPRVLRPALFNEGRRNTIFIGPRINIVLAWFSLQVRHAPTLGTDRMETRNFATAAGIIRSAAAPVAAGRDPGFDLGR